MDFGCAILLDNHLSLTGTNDHLALPWVDHYLSCPWGDVHLSPPWTNMPCSIGVDLQHTVRARELVDIPGVQLLFSLRRDHRPQSVGHHCQSGLPRSLRVVRDLLVV